MPSTPNHNVRDKYANYPHLTDERVKPSQEPSHTSHSDDEGRLLSDLPNHTNIEELPDAHMNQSRLGHIRAPILARSVFVLLSPSVGATQPFSRA